RFTTMACSALALEIARNNLTPCYYLSVRCRRCGELRVGLEEIPTERFHRCPLCNQVCEYTVLGEGGTVRSLPFWDRVQDTFSFAEATRRMWLEIKRSQLQL